MLFSNVLGSYDYATDFASRIRKSYSSQSRAHLTVSTEWVLSQTNENCLCESSWPFTLGLYGSQCDDIIAASCVLLASNLLWAFANRLQLLNVHCMCLNIHVVHVQLTYACIHGQYLFHTHWHTCKLVIHILCSLFSEHERQLQRLK